MKNNKTVLSLIIFGGIAFISLVAGLAVFLSSDFEEENEYRHESITNTAFTIDNDKLYYFNPFEEDKLTCYTFNGNSESYEIKASFYRMHDSFNALAAKDGIVYYSLDQKIYAFNTNTLENSLIYDFTNIKTISLSQFVIKDNYLYFVYAIINNKVYYSLNRLDLSTLILEELASYSRSFITNLASAYTYMLIDNLAYIASDKIEKLSLITLDIEVVIPSLKETYGIKVMDTGEIKYLLKGNIIGSSINDATPNTINSYHLFFTADNHTYFITGQGDIVVTSNDPQKFDIYKLSDIERTTKHHFDYYFTFDDALLTLDLNAGIVLYYLDNIYYVYETDYVFYNVFCWDFAEFKTASSAIFKDFASFPFPFYDPANLGLYQYWSYSINKAKTFGKMYYKLTTVFEIDGNKRTLVFDIYAEYGLEFSELDTLSLYENTFSHLDTEFRLGVIRNESSSFTYLCEGIIDGYLYSIYLHSPIPLSETTLIAIFREFK